MHAHTDRTPSHAPHRQPAARLTVAAALLGALLGPAACAEYEREPQSAIPADARPLELEAGYAGQVLAADGSARYRFHAPYRGAYLIVVSDSTTDTPLTIEHPKKTCHLRGNGSCELISSPDRDYGFEIRQDGGQAVTYSLRVTFWDGLGGYEGQVTDPVALAPGRTHAGRVGVREISYYRFRTGPVGGDYTIRLADVRSDLYWRLFDRAAYDVILYGCDEHVGARAETCRVGPLQPETDYYLLVAERSGVPGAYSVTVLP